MKYYLSAITLSCAAICQAQVNEIDSISPMTPSPAVAGDSIRGLSLDTPVPLPPGLNSGLPVYVTPPTLDLSPNRNIDFQTPRFTPGMAPVAQWQNGGVIASGNRKALPGLMGIESGTLALIQDLGNFSFTASLEANKYGYFRGLTTQYGISGSISYRISSNLSVTLFGAYYQTTKGYGYMTPAMAGYYQTNNFGGYVNWRFSDHWGVKLGAQSYHSLSSQHWEVQPIAVPYYRLDNGAEIGIDVGGILYNILRSNTGSQWGPQNPTIGPPVGGPPPIRPRD